MNQPAPIPDGSPDATLVSPQAGVTTAIAPEVPATAAGSCVLPAIGQELGPVRLIDELGKGAMGVVYLGHHKLLDRKVAVKFLLDTPAAPGEPYSAQFIAEARAAAAVHHPNLTQIYHADLAGNTPYLVMEFIGGPSLAQLLRQAGKLPPPVMLAMIAEVTEAVARLHEHNIIHRDLKASNVLLDRDGRAAVCDFGLAVRGRAAAEDASILCAGTPAYMAPEMFEGRLSFRSDIYALGIVMYQALVGRVPFKGNFEEVRQQHYYTALPLDPLREAGADEPLIDILERATHKQLMFRYKTAQELHRAVTALGIDAAKGRRELERMILATQPNAPASGEGAGGGSSSGGPAPAAGSSGDLLTHALQAKRQRRLSEPHVEVATPPPPPANPIPVLAIGPGDAAAPILPEVAAPSPRCPGSLKTVSILGLTLGGIGTIAVLSNAVLEAHWLPTLKFSFGFRVYEWSSIATDAALIGMLIVGSIGAIMLRRWSRRVLLVYAVAEMVYQLVTVTVANVIWVPHFLGWVQASSRSRTPAEAAQILAMLRYLYGAITVTCGLVVMAFAAGLLIVLRRRRIREALAGRGVYDPNLNLNPNLNRAGDGRTFD